jgi:hypothetical protein
VNDAVNIDGKANVATNGGGARSAMGRSEVKHLALLSIIDSHLSVSVGRGCVGEKDEVGGVFEKLGKMGDLDDGDVYRPKPRIIS